MTNVSGKNTPAASKHIMLSELNLYMITNPSQNGFSLGVKNAF